MTRRLLMDVLGERLDDCPCCGFQIGIPLRETAFECPACGVVLIVSIDLLDLGERPILSPARALPKKRSP
jgi:hypothetical protein